jgi:hypothetical protein
MMEPLQLSCGRWNRPTVTRYEVQFWHSSLSSRTTIDHRRLDRTSTSYKVVIVQEDITEGKDFWYVAEMDPHYLEDVRVAHKAGDGQPLIANDAEIIGMKNQPINA